MSDPLMAKPSHVVRAILTDNKPALRAMSRAGHRAKKRKREKRADEREVHDELAAERRADAEWQRRVSSNEHIIPLSAYD